MRPPRPRGSVPRRSCRVRAGRRRGCGAASSVAGCASPAGDASARGHRRSPAHPSVLAGAEQVGRQAGGGRERCGVVVAENPARAFEGVVVEGAGPSVLVQLAEVGGEVDRRTERVGVIRAEDLPAPTQDLLVRSGGLRVLAQPEQVTSEVVGSSQDVRMLVAEQLRTHPVGAGQLQGCWRRRGSRCGRPRRPAASVRACPRRAGRPPPGAGRFRARGHRGDASGSIRLRTGRIRRAATFATTGPATRGRRSCRGRAGSADRRLRRPGRSVGSRRNGLARRRHHPDRERAAVDRRHGTGKRRVGVIRPVVADRFLVDLGGHVRRAVAGQNPTGLVDVEGLVPARDDQRGDGVADGSSPARGTRT